MLVSSKKCQTIILYMQNSEQIYQMMINRDLEKFIKARSNIEKWIMIKLKEDMN